MTTNWLAEFERCRWDVKRFARVFLGIKLHPGQVRMTEAYLRRTDSKWRAFYYWVMVSAGNRAGKTLALAIIILHSCVYRMGLEPPDVDDDIAVKRWGTIPYHWWHFAVEQGPAEQTFNEITDMLGGVHPAQKAGCPWSTAAGDGDAAKGAMKIATMSNVGDRNSEWCVGSKERGEYAHIKLSAELGGAEVHFRSTKAKALSAIGQNMHGLSFDEAGLQEAPTLKYLLEEVMHARRLGTGGQFIIISTPSAATSAEFEDIWYTGDPDDPFHDPRRFSMSMSTRDNIGYGIDRETFDALILHQSDGWIRQNIDGEFIQAALTWFSKSSVDAAFKEGLPIEQPPVVGKVYVQSLDPGLKDITWSMVFEVLKDGRMRGVHIERQSGKQTTRGIVALGVRNHEAYRQGGKAAIETGVDTTALGGHMFRELLEESIPIRSVEFGGVSKTKRQMISDSRSAFDEGRIEMPAEGDWIEVRRQHRQYKLLDRKLEQDLVMGIAIIVKLVRAAPAAFSTEPDKFDFWATGDERPKTPSRDVDVVSGAKVPF